MASFIDADEEDRGAIGIGAATSIVLHLVLIAVLITWVHGNASLRGAEERRKELLINLEMLKPEPPKPQPPKPEPPKPKQQPIKSIPKPVPQPIITRAPVEAVPTVPPPPPQAEATPKPTAPAAPLVSYEVPSAYKSLLTTQIQSSLVYPLRAKQNDEQGTVRVRVNMGRDGRIIEVTVVSSSGSKLLDEEAKAVFKRIGNMPALPANYEPDSSQFIFELPITFALQAE